MRLAAFVLLLPSMLLHAADHALGRLFYTPAQRAQIDQAPGSALPGQADATHGTPGNLDPGQGSSRLDGVVLRSDGQRTAWIGGRRVHSHHDASELWPHGIPAGARPSRASPAASPRTAAAASDKPDQGSTP